MTTARRSAAAVPAQRVQSSNIVAPCWCRMAGYRCSPPPRADRAAPGMQASCDPTCEGAMMNEEGPGRDSGEAIRDGSANVAPPKQQYCPPVLVSHGRLQMFTAAEGGPVSAGHAIPSDKSDMRLKT